MFRLAERKQLRDSDWLSNVVTQGWRYVTPPPKTGLKIQQFDLDANLNPGLVVQAVKDAFDRMAATTSDPPDRSERAASDGEMAVAVHKALAGLTKREGSDPEF